MKKKEIEKIMKDNCILCFEIENAINFVSDMLEALADETEREEPYAINSIKKMREAAREVRDLENAFDEFNKW